MSAVAEPQKKTTPKGPLTKTQVLQQFHERIAIIHEAERNDLLIHEEVERLIDRYRIEAEAELARVPTGAEIRAKQHAKIMLSHEKEVDEFLNELLKEEP